jgi:L-seryl-tRNA(Ser) seleniumtransferase
MLIENSLQEVKKRENALKIINQIIQDKGRSSLYDLTGLSGGFLLNKKDLELLETYVGPAIFEEMLNNVGKEHLGGEKVLGLNRTSAGILATILALVPPETYLIHYLPNLPSHPSIPRSTKLVGAHYLEFDNINDFYLPENTSLVVITGSTMDHEIIDEGEFREIISAAKTHSSGEIPVLVDDASGARLRTVIFNQPSAIDLGADLVVTSTDKLMDGPRGGLMSGNADLMDQIKSKAHQFGLEAQPPLVAGMVRAIENFNPEKLLNALQKKKKLYKTLNHEFKRFKETPTGVMISADDLQQELSDKGIETQLSPSDLCFVWAMVLLQDEGILTIPAVGMPGASPTIRLDLASKDAKRLSEDEIRDLLLNSFKKFLAIVKDTEECKKLIFGN